MKAKFAFLTKQQNSHTGAEEDKLRIFLRRLFGSDDDLKEERLLFIGKWIIFGLLLLVELLILLQHVEQLILTKNWWSFYTLIAMMCILTIAETLMMFTLKKEKYNFVLYGVEIGAACGSVVATTGVYSLLLYILILTQFYCRTTKLRTALWMYVIALPLYALSYILQMVLVRNNMMVIEILRESFGTFASLTLHFAATELILLFYRQYLRLWRRWKKSTMKSKSTHKW